MNEKDVVEQCGCIPTCHHIEFPYVEYVKPLDPEENCYSKSHEYLLAEKLIKNGYNPFTHTVNNHSFRVDSDDPVLALGYAPSYLEGLNIVATAIPGGRHLRVANSDGSGQFDNFAINLSCKYSK